MISLKKVSMTYGPKVLFTDVTLNLAPKKRYAIAGANGTGKSTLLRLLANQEETAGGDITISNSQTIGFLKQDQFVHEDSRIIDVVIQGKAELWNALQERDSLYQKPDFSDEDGYRAGELEEIIMDQGGYEAEPQAQKFLTGLGIPESKHFEPMKILSGGYKLRVLLAQSLFNDPDILLLDEPTNHLDILTIGWLEKYLIEEYQGTLYFISHDRSFINNLATHVLDIDYGDIRMYTGNYIQFEKEKDLYAEQRKQERLSIEARVNDLKKFVERFKAKASKASQAKSKEKLIDKMEMPDVEKSSRRAPKYDFKIIRPSAKRVLKVENLGHGFGNTLLFDNVKFQINRGDKALILGPNGIGKSTLIKTLMGIHTPKKGTIEWGDNCFPAYFSQDHHDQVNRSMNALQWLEDQLRDKNEQGCRGLLARMLFKSDEMTKPIPALSGGESARLLFSRICGEDHNILVLDEPTNHLDLESIQALIDALKTYPGTIIFVSHDRGFASKLASRVIALDGKSVVNFNGNYKDYLKEVGDDYLSKEWLKTNQ